VGAHVAARHATVSALDISRLVGREVTRSALAGTVPPTADKVLQTRKARRGRGTLGPVRGETMKTTLALGSLSTLVALLLVACGPPSIEDACTEYCEWAEASGCEQGVPAECGVGCGSFEAALEEVGQGDCIDQYAAAFHCIAGTEATCDEDGQLVISQGDCLEEGLDLAECLQVIDD
jgi:hypothetical protein